MEIKTLKDDFKDIKTTEKEEFIEKLEKVEKILNLDSGDFLNGDIEENLERSIIRKRKTTENRAFLEEMILDCFENDDYNANYVYKVCKEEIRSIFNRDIPREDFDKVYSSMIIKHKDLLDNVIMQTQNLILTSNVLEVNPNKTEDDYVEAFQVANARLMLEFAKPNNDKRDLAMLSKAIKENIMGIKTLKGFGDDKKDKYKEKKVDIPIHAWILNINNNANQLPNKEDSNIIDITNNCI